MFQHLNFKILIVGTIFFVLVLLYYLQISRPLRNRNDILFSTIFKNNRSSLVARNITYKEKWIIVTSVNEPTDQIKQLAAIKDFQLLVVGDKKTNQSWSYKNTIFLSLADQEALGFNTFVNTPLHSYTRKNIGKMI